MLAVVSIALPVFALILTGWGAGRARLLGRDSTGAINLFVVWLALPAVLFRAMAQIHPADLLNVGMLASFGLGIAVPFVETVLAAQFQQLALAQRHRFLVLRPDGVVDPAQRARESVVEYNYRCAPGRVARRPRGRGRHSGPAGPQWH